MEAATTWLDLGRLGRRRRARPHQPAHAGEGARGCAGGRGRDQLLSQPPARLPRWHRVEPAALPAGDRAHRGHGRQPRHLLQRRDEQHGQVRRSQVRGRVGGRRGDAVAAVLDAMGLTGARGRRVRRRRRRGRRGRLLQRLPRRRGPGRAEGGRSRRRRAPPLLRPPPGPGAHGGHRACRDGASWSTWPTTWATTGGGSTARRSRRSWRPTTSSSSQATCCCSTRGSPPRSCSGTATPIR